MANDIDLDIIIEKCNYYGTPIMEVDDTEIREIKDMHEKQDDTIIVDIKYVDTKSSRTALNNADIDTYFHFHKPIYLKDTWRVFSKLSEDAVITLRAASKEYRDFTITKARFREEMNKLPHIPTKKENTSRKS